MNIDDADVAPDELEGLLTDLKTVFSTEDVSIATLRPHPRNYQIHPADEIKEICASIKLHGIYKNIVITRDNVILAGHGTVEAARTLGFEQVPVYRADYTVDDPRAWKLLVGDNEIARRAEKDDRKLTENVRDIKDAGFDLEGIGIDEMMLANLVFVTRPSSEIANQEAAAHWAGMPEYQMEAEQRKIVVYFASEADREEFGRRLDVDVSQIANTGIKGTIWWPPKKPDDLKSVLFTDRPDDGVASLHLPDSGVTE